MSGLADFLRKLGAGRLIAMGVVTAGLIAFFSYMTMQFTSQPMSLLFADLDMADSSEILTRLEAMNVPYQLQGDGSTILVPQDQARRLRMSMAEQGIPAGGSVGYEIFDKSEMLGQTSFAQNVNQLRAMEGELARTIRTISTISNARVHLVIPKRELFASGRKQEPTASIVVKTRGQLTNAQVNAIQHLAASAVPGLTPARVAVIDDKGKLLARGVEDDIEDGNMSNIQDKNTEYETLISERLQRLVGSVVGLENVRVQVTAQVNLDRITENAEIFDPNGRVIRSSSTIEEESEDINPKTEGVSVSESLPGATATGAAADNKLHDNRNEETSNFEISRTTRVKTKEAGAIEKVSVAVLINGVTTTQPDGARAYAARSDEDLKQIEALVRTAIGYDEKRGDQVQITNLRFTEMEIVPEEMGETPLMGIEAGEWMRLAETSVLGLVALLTALFVFRPLITRLLEIGPYAGGQLQSALAGPAGVPQLTGPLAGGQYAGSGQGALESSDPMLQLIHAKEQQLDSMIDIAKIDGQVKASSVKKVGEVVGKHPDEAISILRTWLHDKE
ncbi:MAG: flagellar basal-body MS-ring/collar protein FliF [Alphaproteobacteria bacterium]